MRTFTHLLFLFVGLVIWVGFSACTGDEVDDGPKCLPGSEIFCRCPGGDAGTKMCLESGNGFGECRLGVSTPCDDRPGETTSSGSTNTNNTSTSSSSSSGTGGNGQGGAGGGPNPNGAELFEPCIEGSDCKSGICPMGFCTKVCDAVADCAFNIAECINFNDNTWCLPVCGGQVDCDKYGQPSECGFAQAIDDWPVTACADWKTELQHPPDGSACKDHTDCNLGHAGVEKVCGKYTDVCITGCYSDNDCTPKKCSSSSGLGTCY